MTFQHLAVRPRLDALTGARGPAALMVFAQHAGESGFLPFVLPSSLAVSFFFVLSGFVLAYAYFDDRSLGWRFYRARLGRVWPATMLSILLVLLILPRQAYLPQQLDQWMSGLVFLSNGLLLQSLIPIPDFYFGLNAVAWSISVEACFYSVFPVLNRSLKLHGVRALFVVALIGLLVTGLALQLRWPAFDVSALAQPSWHGIVYISPATRLFEFAVGVLAGQVWVNSERWDVKSKITRLLQHEKRRWFVSIAEMLIIVSLITGLYLYQTTHLFSGYETTFAAPLRLLLFQWCTSFALLALILLLAYRQGFFTRTIMCHPLMLRLGELSFGIYLFHQPLMRWLRLQLSAPHSSAGMLNALPPWSYVIIVFIFTLSISAISHDFFEPVVRHWITGKKRT